MVASKAKIFDKRGVEMKNVNLRVEVSTMEALESEAEADDRLVSQLVRIILRKHVEDHSK